MQYPCSLTRRLPLTTLLITAFLSLSAGSFQPAAAQTSASVIVNPGSPVGTIPGTAFGVNTAVWDGSLLDSSVPGLLKQAGATALRFPGGSTSDIYHWQNNSATAGTGQYINPNDTFDAFMSVAQQVGASPVITVNYGSNAAGTGGGDPNEAAAWVDYANNTKKYGVKYWEIGNEIYGNGEYGVQWEEDLHSDHSPTTYGNAVVSYVTAMKAKDATIKIGAVLAAPGNWPDGQSPNWNSTVLSLCGAKIDFVIIHWYPQGPGGESDAGLLSDTSQIAQMISSTRALIKQYCGVNASKVQIFVTETNSVSSNPGKQTVSLVNGLFTADNFMTWLENGVANIDWWALHNGANTGGNNSASLYGSANYGDYGLLSVGASGEPTAETPFAPYYGLQMLSKLGKAGDQMVSASSSQPLLTVHAVKQASGNLALLLINKNAATSFAAGISVVGYIPSSSSTVSFYGINSSSITSSGGRAGNSFMQTAPPYSLTTVVMTPGVPNAAPTFASTASVAPAAVAPSATVTIQGTVTDTGTAYSNATVDLEIFSSGNVKVAQKSFTKQNFTTSGWHSYPWIGTAPAALGVYRVAVGVYSADGKTNLAWNNSAATFTVSPADSAQYNFESGTQGWFSSGGMITGVSSSNAKAYSGSYSLAATFTGSGADTQQVEVNAPPTPAGKTVTFHVWIPAGSQVTAVQPFVQQGSAGGWAWTSNYQAISNLTVGAWNTITVAVPSNAVTPLFQMGVQFFTGAAWSGTCYVDSISW